MHEPSTLDPAAWRLTIGGEVEKPLTLSLADLARIEKHTVTNTLECAGNGRGFQQPHVPGVQWQKGAVGNARFSGPRLRDVLQRAGVKPTGKHVMFHGLDEVPGKVPPFIRSIPIEKATDGDTLIATHMNDAALSKHHGFPARSLVPGWIGAASCKWLSEIKVLDQEFDGNFMKPGYRFPNHPGKPGDPVNPDDMHVLTALNVKSVIAAPGRWLNREVALHSHPGRGLGRRGRYCARRSLHRLRRDLETGATGSRAVEVCVALVDVCTGRLRRRVITLSWRAPPTARAALSPKPRSGIPAAICTMPSIR